MKILTALSQGLSLLLQPLAMPFYGALLLFYGDTVLFLVPGGLKFYYCGLVFITTLLVPAISITMMRRMGMTGDFEDGSRHERTLPLLVALVCTVTCMAMTSDALLVFLLRKVLTAAIACLGVALVINHFWRVSLHMTAAGGMVAVIALVNFAGYGRMTIPLCVAILLAGALGSARLFLGKHNPAQTAVGFFAGFVAGGAAALLF